MSNIKVAEGSKILFDEIDANALKDAIKQLEIEAEIDTNKKYLIPHDWTGGGKKEFQLSRERVKNILLINNVNFLEV